MTAQPRILTLLSDFGLSDCYVGVMKGAIAQVNPALTVIDLTHQIPPQNIALARFALMTAYPYFSAGTVHVAVVDPGVGGTRRAIALSVGEDPTRPNGFLVGPDNGLLSGIFTTHPVIAAVALTKPQYWRSATPSATFHGRDLFAPVGAHLASGVPLTEVGESIAPETLVRLNVPQCLLEETSTTVYQGYRISGCVQAIDHFGNIITNIPGAYVVGTDWSLSVNGETIPGRTIYGDRQPRELLALVGSHSWVEIAVSGGNAQDRLCTDRDDLRIVVETVSRREQLD
ncbi:MAG: SAM-dependent chlorinase/fluorinase [Stenomitos rutilans HA7619-LM2]|nr:SAM-dependent chlorinase/fluorinase [Stenomitos rutilans HA7619-LM2]